MGTLAHLAEDIATAQFRLRSCACADEPRIVAALSEPAVAMMLSSVPHPYPPQAAREWLGQQDEMAGNGHLVRAIDVGGTLAGVVALTPHDESGGRELGYWVAPSFWGQGLATRAAARLIAEAWSPGDTTPGVFARAAVDNPASARVLQKLGFEPVGVAERHFVSRGRPVRCHLFWLDRRGPQLSLETRRLVLTRPYAADIPRLVAFLGDMDIARQTARIPHPYRRTDAEAFVSGTATRGELAFAIRLKDEDGALIGGAGFGGMDGGTPELGYWLAPPFWGRGLATEAARAVIDLAFGDDAVREVHASARVTNVASRHVLEKCGFQQCGTGLIRSRAVGGAVPVDRFRLDRRTWLSILAWRPAIRHGRAPELESIGPERIGPKA